MKIKFIGTLTTLMIFLVTTSVLQSNQKLLEDLENAHSDFEQLQALENIIKYKLTQLDYDNIEYLKKAELLVQDQKFEGMQPKIYVYLGEHYKNHGDHFQSINYLLKALKYYEDRKDNLNIAKTCRLIGETYRAALEYTKSLEYLHRAIKLSQISGDLHTEAWSYNRIGATLYEIKNDSTKRIAIDYVYKSLSLKNKINDKEISISNNNILGACFRSLTKYDSALYYFNMALSIIDSSNERYYKANIMNNITYCYWMMGEYNKSIEVGESNLSFVKKNELAIFKGHLYSLLSKAYYNTGNFKKAYEYKEFSNNINDSLFYESKNQQINDLQVKYETKQREEELVHQKDVQFYQLMIFIIALILISGIFLILYHRQKELSNMNKTISDQNVKLQELLATKDKFFSIIAHDLKNPISAFKQLSEILADGYETFEEGEKVDYLKTLKESSNNLLNLLDNILTWSRSQQGTITFIPDTYNLKYLVDNTLEELKLQASRKGIELESHIPQDLHAWFDPNMISTIIRNLCSNSLKFSEAGSKVEISIENDTIVDNGNSFEYYKMSIRDFGIGMNQQTVDKLFRIDESISSLGTSGEKGTGLGLILCKEFIDKHKGKIWAESTLGEGSKFNFTIPAQPILRRNLDI